MNWSIKLTNNGVPMGRFEFAEHFEHDYAPCQNTASPDKLSKREGAMRMRGSHLTITVGH
jgi:hypothetical protein